MSREVHVPKSCPTRIFEPFLKSCPSEVCVPRGRVLRGLTVYTLVVLNVKDQPNIGSKKYFFPLEEMANKCILTNAFYMQGEGDSGIASSQFFVFISFFFPLLSNVTIP